MILSTVQYLILDCLAFSLTLYVLSSYPSRAHAFLELKPAALEVLGLDVICLLLCFSLLRFFFPASISGFAWLCFALQLSTVSLSISESSTLLVFVFPAHFLCCRFHSLSWPPCSTFLPLQCSALTA